LMEEALTVAVEVGAKEMERRILMSRAAAG
jgi:hypothetical protein